jgi:nitrate reductase gamma subunit
MSDFLHFAEYDLQEVALSFMAIVYIIRLIWLFRFKGGRDRQPPTGSDKTTPTKGILYSWANIASPWAMESTRNNKFLYVQFAVFHIGVTAAIGLSFVIPYAPDLLNSIVAVRIIQALTGAAFLVGILRFIRRVSDPYMRAISTPDDYFSLLLLTIWFLFTTLAVPNNAERGEGILLTYFIMTAFFLIYVPFSKISHYLYYPFTRLWFGRTMGHRGVYPMKRSIQTTKAGK